MRILNKRTGEVREAYSLELHENKAAVVYIKNGKEHLYHKDNIELLTADPDSVEVPFTVYQFTTQCPKCHKETPVYTYIVYNDGTDEDVTYPWNKLRLLQHQSIIPYIKDTEMQYYGLKVLGSDAKLDSIMLLRFPGKLKPMYSWKQKRSYPMNICPSCGAKLIWEKVYRQVNTKIQNGEEIDILKV